MWFMSLLYELSFSSNSLHSGLNFCSQVSHCLKYIHCDQTLGNQNKTAYNSYNTLENRHTHNIIIVDIHLHTFNPRTASAKYPIPNACLLAIVMALLPSLTMMQIMVLDHQLCIKHSHQPCQRVRRRSMETKTTMSSKFRKHNIELTNMPFVETHRHTYEFHSEISHQRDPRNIEEFLF